MKQRSLYRRSALPGLLLAFLLAAGAAAAQQAAGVRLVPVDSGWARNSINAVAFRKNSLVTHNNTQYIAFYNSLRYVVLGRRTLGDSRWELKQTPYQGNTADAHNAISLMVDGAGYLHLSWDHHNNALRYCQSKAPGSLELTDKMPMTGQGEQRVSYPEFYRLPDGNLLFLYRDGASGSGNLVVNRFDLATRQWTQLHRNLIDGEGRRNAYWQAGTDSRGVLHLSWVWRESPDVASNHDLCYARSADGGRTWQKSNGENYSLPITAATAEYAWKVPQQSELINQTALSCDAAGRPFIATYWRDGDSRVPQYRLVYHNGRRWQLLSLNFRTAAFSLSGAGSKRIPIARPQVVVQGRGRAAGAVLVFRDEERGSRVSVAVVNKVRRGRWQLADLTRASVGSWEPTYDTELWKTQRRLHLFVQQVEQVDAEGIADMPPQPVQVLEWKPDF